MSFANIAANITRIGAVGGFASEPIHRSLPILGARKVTKQSTFKYIKKLFKINITYYISVGYTQRRVIFDVVFKIIVSFKLTFIMENKVSIQIPPADLLAIKDAIAVLQAKLGPLVIALTPDQRSTRFKMGEASRPFVEKVVDYSGTDPQFLPAFAKVDKLLEDWKAYKELTPVYNALNQLLSGIDDTLLELGIELMKVANAYYLQTKTGVKLDVPGAKPVYEDLRVRYEQKPKKKENGSTD